MSIEPGTALDRYVVETHLNTGGLSVTYLVRHADLDTHHLLQVPRKASRGLAERFLQQARLQASLRHQNLVAVTDLIRVDERPSPIFDWVDGVRLGDLVERTRLSIEQVDWLARGIMDGVEWLHHNGVVHRDLKAMNVIVEMGGEEWIPRLTNLALAKRMGHEEPGAKKGKGPRIFGTPWFMSPEATYDSGDVDTRADLWSLGCILYVMITGRLPFAADVEVDPTDPQQLARIFAEARRGVYMPVRILNRDAPVRMSRAIDACLKTDRADRVPDVATLRALWSEGTAASAVRTDRPPNGTIALVFTDVQGSTDLWNEAPDVMRHALIAHDAILRRVLRENDGYEVKTEGDAFMVAFRGPRDAIRFCVEAQVALYQHPWATDLLARPHAAERDGNRGLRVRMGVHVGPVEQSANPTTGRIDYFGPTVNEAARVASGGHGGQILVSDEAWDLAKVEVQNLAEAKFAGKYLLKGFTKPRGIYEVFPRTLERRDLPPPTWPPAWSGPGS